ncbi:hypothetical protein GCK72_007873 [Caenorhabditis remanei]|uniref:DUF38 domain-containing protein n=1 Tax=Caenorhabditis remanei TaxID=31234 RepID=A0A6A5HNI2_CAERE|nr:hypothetical protein GCK72_007873 [Caenorhabditis remanei]KAF1767913.1 hypothetical protein GCK72_007873 [Caenorhabditis remanei]
MPLPLSYPGLKCVLENLEAVKRAHIIGRSPGLQKIDKLIPLCLENLCIDSDEVTINKLTIECDNDGVKFEMHGKTFSRKGLDSQEEAIKNILKYFICKKGITRVDKLDWCYSLFPDVSEALDINFRVNFLFAPSRHNFETAVHFIDPSSFPLKNVITAPDTSTFDEQIVKFAETLNLNIIIDRIVTVEDLKKLNNKIVVFQCVLYPKIEMVPLIKYHVETKKVVETTFIIATYRKDAINDMLREFELVFGDFRCDLDNVNERFIPGSSKYLIPINNESKIQVYAIEVPEESGRLKIVVKPVSGL